MPSCYAHRKFGIDVFKELSPDTRSLIRTHLPLFLIGLHGPDLLFYHHFGVETPVSRFGHKLHHTEFFTTTACCAICIWMPTVIRL